MQSIPAPPMNQVALVDLELRDARLGSLHAVREFLANHRDDVLAILTESATYQAASYELEAAIRTLDGARDEIDRHRPVTVGALAAFMPSNVLLYSYVLYLLVPALYVRQLSFRAASQVAAQTSKLHNLLRPVHDLPIEQHHLSQRTFLTGPVAAADVVVFTGSYQNAERIRPQLLREQLFAFFGAGVNPFVVTAGADVEQAAADAVAIRILNCGQDCLAPDVFFVHRDHRARFVDAIMERLRGLRYGPYDDPAAEIGPIFYEGALEAAAVYLSRHRDRIVHGGSVDFRQRRLEPAVLVSEVTNRPALAEFFTPIFNVVEYHDETALANLLDGGSFVERALGASVHGPAPELVHVLSRRHSVTVDETLLVIDDGNRPFGGRGPMANYLSRHGALTPKPILLSAAVEEHFGRAE